MSAHFYLVQRLASKNPIKRDNGFDGYFSLDYMGSSEFEWGAIPKALREMRQKPAVMEAAKVVVNDIEHEVFFVGHEGVGKNAKSMEDWASGVNVLHAFRGKEWTHFDNALNGTQLPYEIADAWWDVENAVAWSLDPQIGQLLVEAFNSRKPAVK